MIRAFRNPFGDLIEGVDYDSDFVEDLFSELLPTMSGKLLITPEEFKRDHPDVLLTKGEQAWIYEQAFHYANENFFEHYVEDAVIDEHEAEELFLDAICQTLKLLELELN